MKLITREDKMIAPEYKNDLETFMHCTNGMTAVKLEYFVRVVQPLFSLHGIKYSITTSKPSADT